MQGEWAVGLEHQELLHSAIQRQRREKKAIVTQEKDALDSKIPPEELATSISKTLESNFDSLFDSFTEFDVQGRGKLSALEFREGIRSLSPRFFGMSDSAIDKVYTLIDAKDTGAVTLEQYVNFFSQRVGFSRPTAVHSAKNVMPLTSGLRLKTARNDVLAAQDDRGSKFRTKARYILSPERPVSNGANTYQRSQTWKDSGIAKRSLNIAPSLSIDFESRNKWIDDMMSKLGINQEQSPVSMHEKWNDVLKECQLLDTKSSSIISVEGFRNALIRAEPKLSAEQVEWLVKDANKDEFGDIKYVEYVARRSAASPLRSFDSVKSKLSLLCTEAKIRAAIRINYTTVKQAFKSMDSDRDGRLSKEEFRIAVEKKLRLKVHSQLLDLVFASIDANHDGYIEYEQFRDRLKILPAEKKPADLISNEEISKKLLAAYANIAQTFSKVDQDCDGIVSCEDILRALQDPRIGLDISLQRAADFAVSIDTDGNGVIDYRDFLRHFSCIASEESTLKAAVDTDVYDQILAIRNRLRETFDDAKQAFHAFDINFAARLSLQDFIQGVRKYVTASAEIDTAELKKLEKVFDLVDTNGDGFIDYHDFITRFHVKPKHFGAEPVEKQIRQVLRNKFPASITAAFQALDLDQDEKLSWEDLKEGLAQLGLRLHDDQIRALLRRADLDEDSFIEYDEFILRFGLESAPTGQWVYKIPEQPSASERDKEAVIVFGRHMIASKWWGRGGVIETLKRFDQNADGKLDSNEFKAALIDDVAGLSMSQLSDEEVAILLGGVNMDKPYCDTAKKTVDILKFGQFFIDAYFDQEKRLMKLLLVENKWQDIKEALDSKSIPVPSNQGRLISKADLALALHDLVSAGIIRSEDRDTLTEVCIFKKLFAFDGLYAGYLDFEKDLLESFIATEMEIHAKILPIWKEIASKMMALGGSLTYSQLEHVLYDFHIDDGRCFSQQQVAWLIDVLDKNCDGSVSYHEMIHRYARDEHYLTLAMEYQWVPLWKLLDQAAPKSKSKPITLPVPLMQIILIKAVDSKLLTGLEKPAISRLLKNVKSDLLSKEGEVICERWIHRYVGQRFLIHKALECNIASGLPLWDRVIQELEALERCRLEADEEISDPYLVSRQRLVKILKNSGLEFGECQQEETLLNKLLEDLDPSLSGTLNWMDLIEGNGVIRAYYFSAKDVLSVRRVMKSKWREALQVFSEADTATMHAAVVKISDKQGNDTGSSPVTCDNGSGLLSKTVLQQCLDILTQRTCSEYSQDNQVVDIVSKPPKMTRPIASLLLKYSETAFGLAVGNQEVVINYIAMLQHYAQEEWSAQEELALKNEMVTRFLSLLCRNMAEYMEDGKLPRTMVISAIFGPSTGLSEPLASMLLEADLKPGEQLLDLHAMAWRAVRQQIFKILDKRWYFLYSDCCRSDASSQGCLSAAVFQDILAAGNGGFSNSQTKIFMRFVHVDGDGRVEYRSILSGKGIKDANGYRNVALEAWMALETPLVWDCLDRLVTDSSIGGPVSCGACFMDQNGYHVEAQTFIACLMQRRRFGGDLDVLDIKGLEKVVEILAPAPSKWISLDYAVWLLCSRSLRHAFFRHNNGEISRHLKRRFRQELVCSWDKFAEARHLEGYKQFTSFKACNDAIWGLQVDLTERCIRECVKSLAGINHLHVGAMVRRAIRASRQPSEDMGPLLHVTEEGLHQTLQELQQNELMPLSRSYSITFSLDQIEPQGDKVKEEEEFRTLFGVALEAATNSQESWLEFEEGGRGEIIRCVERKAVVWLQGCCGQHVQPLNSREVAPAPLHRTHLRQIFDATHGHACTEGCTAGGPVTDPRHEPRDAVNDAIRRDKLCRELSANNNDEARGWRVGQEVEEGLEQMWLDRQACVYTCAEWRLICMQRASFSLATMAPHMSSGPNDLAPPAHKRPATAPLSIWQNKHTRAAKNSVSGGRGYLDGGDGAAASHGGGSPASGWTRKVLAGNYIGEVAGSKGLHERGALGALADAANVECAPTRRADGLNWRDSGAQGQATNGKISRSNFSNDMASRASSGGDVVNPRGRAQESDVRGGGEEREEWSRGYRGARDPHLHHDYTIRPPHPSIPLITPYDHIRPPRVTPTTQLLVPTSTSATIDHTSPVSDSLADAYRDTLLQLQMLLT